MPGHLRGTGAAVDGRRELPITCQHAIIYFARGGGGVQPAWYVHLLYAPGVKWIGECWMHQLREESGADQRACLNPAVFEGKVAELLRPTKGGA